MTVQCTYLCMNDCASAVPSVSSRIRQRIINGTWSIFVTGIDRVKENQMASIAERQNTVVDRARPSS